MAYFLGGRWLSGRMRSEKLIFFKKSVQFFGGETTFGESQLSGKYGTKDHQGEVDKNWSAYMWKALHWPIMRGATHQAGGGVTQINSNALLKHTKKGL